MRTVKVAPGYSKVPLPDGLVYNQGALVHLSEAQYAEIPPQILQQLILISTRPDPNPVVPADSYSRTFQGPPGPAGPAGPQGPQGNPGIGAATVYTVTAISSWTQTHSLPYPPQIRLIDGNGDEVEIAVHYPDNTSVSLSFPTPFTGRIVLA